MRPAKIFLAFAAPARRNYFHEGAIARLRQLGELRLNEADEALSPSALIKAANSCQVIVSDRATCGDAELFAQCRELAVFMRCAVDVRNIDLAAASAQGVLVTHASAGFANAVAEWVLGMMLDLSRHLSASVLCYRSGQLAPVRMGVELRGATLGVMGYGEIGRRLCTLGVALGMHVLVFDPFTRVDETTLEQRDIDSVVAGADYLVCLVPASSATANLMNATRFAQMKAGAFFINAARGELVDEDALLQALDSRHLAGCAIDVGRAADQMPSAKLACHPCVLATPHTGGLTPQAAAHQADETVAQLEALWRGLMPIGALNAPHATRLAKLD